MGIQFGFHDLLVSQYKDGGIMFRSFEKSDLEAPQSQFWTQMNFIQCPGVWPYLLIPPLPDPPYPPWPPELGPMPRELARLTRKVHKKLTKFVRRWNKMTRKMQRYADSVSATVGDNKARHVVLALQPDGMKLALSAAMKPHDHFDLYDALSKINRKSLKGTPDTLYDAVVKKL